MKSPAAAELRRMWDCIKDRGSLVSRALVPKEVLENFDRRIDFFVVVPMQGKSPWKGDPKLEDIPPLAFYPEGTKQFAYWTGQCGTPRRAFRSADDVRKSLKVIGSFTPGEIEAVIVAGEWLRHRARYGGNYYG